MADDDEDAIPARKPRYLSPEQLRMAYGALLNHSEPFLRRLALTRLEALHRQPPAAEQSHSDGSA